MFGFLYCRATWWKWLYMKTNAQGDIRFSSRNCRTQKWHFESWWGCGLWLGETEPYSRSKGVAVVSEEEGEGQDLRFLERKRWPSIWNEGKCSGCCGLRPQDVVYGMWTLHYNYRKHHIEREREAREPVSLQNCHLWLEKALPLHICSSFTPRSPWEFCSYNVGS